MEGNRQVKSPLQAANLAGLPHGFFGRGSSLDDADDLHKAAANRTASGAVLMENAPIALNHQVHGNHCRIIDSAFDPAARPPADALATRTPGILLGIHTADCAPVLLADARAGVVGAAHAGWHGALGGVTDSVVAAMESLGANRSNIAAAVGPCIARANYEVDDDFCARFIDADAQNNRFFTDGPKNRAHFDLESYVAHRLASAGIGHVALLGIDTYAHKRAGTFDYWSHRRGTHSGVPEKGRQIAMIGLKSLESQYG
jgi:polyphenol oxidase